MAWAWLEHGLSMAWARLETNIYQLSPHHSRSCLDDRWQTLRKKYLTASSSYFAIVVYQELVYGLVHEHLGDQWRLLRRPLHPSGRNGWDSTLSTERPPACSAPACGTRRHCTRCRSHSSGRPSWCSPSWARRCRRSMVEEVLPSAGSAWEVSFTSSWEEKFQWYMY